MTKKISVVMCTYNGADHLEEQLNSIINQTYPIYEFIIQDDCSIDSTVSILKEYERQYSYIRVYINEKQKGINENFFSAMERAKGDFIAISDQDDIWEPNKIEIQINTIEDKWVSCGFSKPFLPNKEIFFDKRVPNLRIERLIYINMMGGHTMLLNKKLLSLIPEKTKILYDHVILIVAASNNMISFVNYILVNHREHEKSATYTVPVMKRGGNNKSIGNIARSLFRTLRLYIKLRDDIHKYFLEMYAILKDLPDWQNKKIALKLAKYQSQKGFLSYIKLTYYCIKARRCLFHTTEKDNILTLLRAIYFPISISDYFRYMAK
jgi:glycosyltransferase involved in cell wall biosynthesis